MALIRDQLVKHPSNSLIISVSAASNITSKITDLVELNSIISKKFTIYRGGKAENK
jgi:hypothetical protein